MRVVRKSLIQGAKSAEGVAVIIDVFRAFTTTPLFFHYGAEKVVFVKTPEEAFAIKSRFKNTILAGEVNEKIIPGFDLGNSPTELLKKPERFLEGKTVIQRTTAGVIGVINVMDSAGKVILGSYVMAGAVAGHILSEKPFPEIVTIVAMGSRGLAEAPEDEGCADYLEHLLAGTPYDHLESLRNIIFNETAQKFLRGDKTYLPSEDPLFCLQRNLFNFVLLAGREGDLVTVTRKNIDENYQQKKDMNYE
jgi:2-phosphosulfolactate phosphatase